MNPLNVPHIYFFAFALNALIAVALLANSCGNYFALGMSYGDGQECASWLEQYFSIMYFSQSSPFLGLDDLGVLVAGNWILFRLSVANWFSNDNGAKLPVFLFFAFIGFALPLVGKEFLPH